MKNRVIPLEVKGTVNTIINGKRRRTVEEHEKYVDIRNECYRKRSEKNKTISYFTGFDDGFEQAKKQFTKQIEKMKCCCNCEYYNTTIDGVRSNTCRDCKNQSNWELEKE